MPFYERGPVRIHYEEVGSGFPLSLEGFAGAHRRGRGARAALPQGARTRHRGTSNEGCRRRFVASLELTNRRVRSLRVGRQGRGPRTEVDPNATSRNPGAWRARLIPRWQARPLPCKVGCSAPIIGAGRHAIALATAFGAQRTAHASSAITGV